jgi:hypothetical protein
MPPRQKTALQAIHEPVEMGPKYNFPEGSFVNVVINGQARHKNAEVLGFREYGMFVRSNANGVSLAEVTFVPWSAIEGVGLIGQR